MENQDNLDHLGQRWVVFSNLNDLDMSLSASEMSVSGKKRKSFLKMFSHTTAGSVSIMMENVLNSDVH